MSTSTITKSSRKMYMSLAFFQDAIVQYYADKYTRDAVDIIRTVVTHYAKADNRFDAQTFQEYVKTRYVKMLESIGGQIDEELLAEIDRQVEAFLGQKYNPTMSTMSLVKEIPGSGRKKATATKR